MPHVPSSAVVQRRALVPSVHSPTTSTSGIGAPASSCTVTVKFVDHPPEAPDGCADPEIPVTPIPAVRPRIGGAAIRVPLQPSIVAGLVVPSLNVTYFGACCR